MKEKGEQIHNTNSGSLGTKIVNFATKFIQQSSMSQQYDQILYATYIKYNIICPKNTLYNEMFVSPTDCLLYSNCNGFEMNNFVQCVYLVQPTPKTPIYLPLIFVHSDANEKPLNFLGFNL